MIGAAFVICGGPRSFALACRMLRSLLNTVRYLLPPTFIPQLFFSKGINTPQIIVQLWINLFSFNYLPQNA